MPITRYSQLVESAQQKRRVALEEAFTTRQSEHNLAVWARELDIVNKHITVKPELVSDAADAYDDIGRHLVDRLKWPSNAIAIHPQGSTSTQTLIASPSADKFDIDAVCRVDISRIEAFDPMRFFDNIGSVLDAWKAEAKNRCWRVNFPNKRFYIDFTPSAPLSTVPGYIQESLLYRPTSRYQDTALAVVDTPTRKWKTSNPEGFAAWVNEQAARKILVQLKLAEEALAKRMDVEPVPSQEVPLSDTLRVAIRLFKRHRDMAVRRGLIDGECKPISIIIVTLLTQCYEGLADNGTTYTHPIKLLIDLVGLLPGMIERRNGEYWIVNPTVDGENFAERWNHDNGKRAMAFNTWCDLLINDLITIFAATTEHEVRSRVQSIFGCVGTSAEPKPTGGLADAAPTKVTPVRRTQGLA